MKEDYKAILFDLDGVLLNSEDTHAKAKQITLQTYNIDYGAGIFSEFKGRTDSAFFTAISERYTGGTISAEEMADFKKKQYIRLYNEVTAVPGAFEFLQTARDYYCCLALVSSASASDLSLAEERFKLGKWFNTIVFRDSIDKHKPHPDPYLKALENLGISATEALVIEDSPNGVLSAKKAGCTVIGILTGFSSGELMAAGADNIVENFPELVSLLWK